MSEPRRDIKNVKVDGPIHEDMNRLCVAMGVDLNALAEIAIEEFMARKHREYKLLHDVFASSRMTANHREKP